MGYSTTIKIAYGVDLTGFEHLEAVQDETVFDELLDELDLDGVIEMDYHGDARIGSNKVAIARRTKRRFHADDISDLELVKPMSPQIQAAFTLLIERLGIDATPGWKLYGHTS